MLQKLKVVDLLGTHFIFAADKYRYNSEPLSSNKAPNPCMGVFTPDVLLYVFPDTFHTVIKTSQCQRKGKRKQFFFEMLHEIIFPSTSHDSIQWFGISVWNCVRS